MLTFFLSFSYSALTDAMAGLPTANTNDPTYNFYQKIDQLI